MGDFKIANAGLQKKIEQATAELEELTSAEDLRRLKPQQKLVVDAIKMVAYQQESDLYRRLFGKYARLRRKGAPCSTPSSSHPRGSRLVRNS